MGNGKRVGVRHAAVSLLLVLGLGLSSNAFGGPAEPGGQSAAAGAEVAVPAVAPTGDPAINTGDNAWMLTSSALVLMMTAPGLALFYCGLVRKKNVLGVMMQCVFLMCLMAVVWALWGYTLAFGGSGPYVGSSDYLALQGVQSQWVESLQDVRTPMEGSIPRLTHMLFQGMFFIITPALICGAFAERMKFSTMVVFMVLWGTLVYCPLCHWVWDGGILAYGVPGALGGGVLDFAGGTVVHVSSGVSALICALLIGKRLGFGSEPMPPHNLTYTAIGATLLWVGWFGFNGGSALSAGRLASSAFAVTHFGAAAGALVWAGLEWIGRGKPSILGTCSGMVAGLAGVTPATGFVQPIHGLAIGAICAMACFYACTKIKNLLGYDDSLDVFGVHGVSGIVGTILTGVFATRAVADPAVSKGQVLGLIEGGSAIVGQIVAVGLTTIFAVVSTFVLLKILDSAMGLRVSHKEEIDGLDWSQHGEEGYILI